MPQSKNKEGGAIVSVGRHKDNSIVFDDDLISSRHAQIIIHGDLHFVKDLDSKSGTWVNGVRVKMLQLKDGDVVAFGSEDFSFVFSLEDDEGAQSKNVPKDQIAEKIDLTQAPRKQKLYDQKTSGLSPANGSGNGSKTAEPGENRVKEISGKNPPKIETGAETPAPAEPYPEAQQQPPSFWSRPVVKVAAVVLVSIAILWGGSWFSRMHAYNAGYTYGLEEFANPPRNLSPAMIDKFAKPAAFRLQIKDADYPEFVRGIDDACFKTYLRRYRVGPHLKQ